MTSEQPDPGADPSAAAPVRPDGGGLSAPALLRWAVTDGSVVARALRFGLVGATSGVIFGASTAVLISGFGVSPNLASVLGYIISMPVNFFGNRSFSFRSKGNVIGEALRFVGLHLANMAVTAGAMSTAVGALKLHYLFGIFGAIVLVPIANFALMNLWVFDKRASSAR